MAVLEIRIIFSRVVYISYSFASPTRERYLATFENIIGISARPCNILYLLFNTCEMCFILFLSCS